MILSNLPEEQRKTIISNRLKELLKLTYNYDLLKIVDYLTFDELKKCYITVFNSYNERPFYIKKNMEVGILKIK